MENIKFKILREDESFVFCETENGLGFCYPKTAFFQTHFPELCASDEELDMIDK